MPIQKSKHTPLVSIIIPNLNGREILECCLDSVAKLQYPTEQIECIVVDNGSVDGSHYFINTNYPDVKVLALGTNTGYATAINVGAKASRGEILLLLNNDAQLDPACLTMLVEPIASNDTVCTTAQIINPARTQCYFDGGGMNFHGLAYQHGEGQPYEVRDRVNQACLFPCGAAMAIRTEVFLATGGMDEEFFAYFEDVDLGWRLWVMGFDVMYVPNAIVTHDQSQTSRSIATSKLRVLHLRNPLLMLYKNYDDANLAAVLPVAWMLTTQRMLHGNGLDQSHFRIDDEVQLAEPSSGACDVSASGSETTDISTLSASGLIALEDWLSSIDGLEEKRATIQASRVRPDREITRMFLDPFRYAEPDPKYRNLQNRLCKRFGVDRVFEDEINRP